MKFLVLLTIFSAASAATLPGIRRRQRGEDEVCAEDEISCEGRDRTWCCPGETVCGKRRGQCEEPPKPTKTGKSRATETPDDVTSTTSSSKKPQSTSSKTSAKSTRISSTSHTQSPLSTDSTSESTPNETSPLPTVTPIITPTPTPTESPPSSTAAAVIKSKTPTEKFFTTPRLAAIIGGSVAGLGLIALISFLCYRKRKQGRLLLAAYDNPYRIPYEEPSIASNSQSGAVSRSPTPDMTQAHVSAGPLGSGTEAYKYHNADALESAFNRPAPPSRTATPQVMLPPRPPLARNPNREVTRPRVVIPMPETEQYAVSPIAEPRGVVWSPFPPRRPQVGAEVYFQNGARAGRTT